MNLFLHKTVFSNENYDAMQLFDQNVVMTFKKKGRGERAKKFMKRMQM